MLPRTFLRLVLLLFLLGVAAFTPTSPAGAHSGLLVAVPAPGDEVGGEFDLQLYFGEPVETVVVRVLDPNEVDIVVSQAEPVVGLIEVDVSPLTVEGVYVVTYAVSYSDGAEFDSIYQFTYETEADPPLPLEFDDLEPTSSVLSTVALWVLVGASTVLVLLLAWRFRQTQTDRMAEEHDGTTSGAG